MQQTLIQKNTNKNHNNNIIYSATATVCGNVSKQSTFTLTLVRRQRCWVFLLSSIHTNITILQILYLLHVLILIWFVYIFCSLHSHFYCFAYLMVSLYVFFALFHLLQLDFYAQQLVRLLMTGKGKINGHTYGYTQRYKLY